MSFLRKFKYLLGTDQKLKVIGFLVCIILAAALELLSLSLMIPLVMAVLDASFLQKLPFLQKYESILNQWSRQELIIGFLLAFFLVILLKNLFVFVTKIYRRSFIVTSNYRSSSKLYNTYLHCDYEDVLMRNSNDIIRNIVYVSDHSYILLEALLELLAELCIVIFMLGFLLFINWRVTLILFFFLSGLLLLYYGFSNKKLQQIGRESNSVYLYAMERVRESILAFKEIQLMNRESVFFKRYSDNHLYNVKLEKKKAYYSVAPAHVTEVCVFAALCLYIGIAVSLDMDPARLVAELSVVSLAAWRMIPSVNRINANANRISLYMPSFNQITGEFIHYLKSDNADANFADVERMPFQHSVTLQDICYRYPHTETDILQHVNLHVEKGDKIGIIGVSGGGKTTLVDILLGYLKPYQGKVLVDGIDIATNRKGWMLNIGYIPQMIFLLDGTIRNNILLGYEEGDERKIWEALCLAQLDEFVKGLPKGLDTEIGERGIKLSGGQRQRVGIARALYNDSQLLVFDEATSALDKETEAELMKAIDTLDRDKTIIIVSHNVNTLHNCNKIYRVQDKRLVEVEHVSERTNE